MRVRERGLSGDGLWCSLQYVVGGTMGLDGEVRRVYPHV